MVEKRRKINWSAAEFTQLARRVIELQAGGAVFEVAIVKAQNELLEPHRRKEFASQGAVYSTRKSMEPYLQMRKVDLQIAKEDIQDRVEQKEEHTSVPSVVGLEEILINIIAKGIERGLEAVLPKLQSVQLVPTAQAGKHNPEPVSVSPRPDMHKIAIAGLIGPQERQIEKDYEGCNIDFRFIPSNAQAAHATAIAKGSDIVYIHTGHMSHQTESVLRGSGVPICRVPGGMSQLREAIDNRLHART